MALSVEATGAFVLAAAELTVLRAVAGSSRRLSQRFLLHKSESISSVSSTKRSAFKFRIPFFRFQSQRFERPAGKPSRAMVAPGSTMTTNSQSGQLHDVPATELAYYDSMQALQSSAKFLALITDGDRLAVIVDSTILYPQGGGQPYDTGYISSLDDEIKFRVEDVRSKGDHVYHYGSFVSSEAKGFDKGQEVVLKVDADRRTQNSRLHTAGHLLDACMSAVGLPSLYPSKAHHFPDSPFVEYKGTIPAAEIEAKRAQLEDESNRRIEAGGTVKALIASYDEATDLCGGHLPEYIPKDSSPRIVMVGGLGCPCGGTHVADISEIGRMKVPQIRVKKGFSKVSYSVTAATT